jgi:hypothetical protein
VTINIELPDDIYQRLSDVAASTHQPFHDVLVQTIRGNLPPTLADLPPERREIVADLQHLPDAALWAVAKEALPAPQWRRHQQLLQKAEAGTLAAQEQTQLTALREATDRFVLRRSYALALLKWRGHTIVSTQ